MLYSMMTLKLKDRQVATDRTGGDENKKIDVIRTAKVEGKVIIMIATRYT